MQTTLSTLQELKSVQQQQQQRQQRQGKQLQHYLQQQQLLQQHINQKVEREREITELRKYKEILESEVEGLRKQLASSTKVISEMRILKMETDEELTFLRAQPASIASHSSQVKGTSWQVCYMRACVPT